MDFKDTLGVVVNSNRYFEFVTKITDAALGNGKKVRLCLLGAGIEYIRTKAYARLSRKTRISLCTDSTQAVCHDEGRGGHDNFVPPQEFASILQNCHRYVVF